LSPWQRDFADENERCGAQSLRAVFSPHEWRSNISGVKKGYTDQEFALILSKASELARSSDVAGRPPTGLSLEEMKAIAAEVGLDAALIERAARSMPAASSESRLEQVLGGPLKHQLDAHFATKLTEGRTAHLLSAVRAAIEMKGEGEANASGMSWNSVGEGSQVYVTAHAEGEGTRVRVTVDRRDGLILTGTSSVLGALAVGIIGVVGASGVEQSVVFGATVIGGGVLGSLALARAAWASTTRKFRGKVDAMMDTVSRSLAESGGEQASSEETGGPDPRPE
jgi:hypothetical protein